jgi:fucose 4-O-acetylase-like acetyltransferase
MVKAYFIIFAAGLTVLAICVHFRVHEFLWHEVYSFIRKGTRYDWIQRSKTAAFVALMIRLCLYFRRQKKKENARK